MGAQWGQRKKSMKRALVRVNEGIEKGSKGTLVKVNGGMEKGQVKQGLVWVRQRCGCGSDRGVAVGQAGGCLTGL